MMIAMTSMSGRTFCGMVALVACLLWISTESAEGQTPTPGNNAVYNASGNCSTSSACAGSSAFIDAFILSNINNTDLCTTIHNILQPATYSAAVIDARGISGSALTCASSPWGSGSGYLSKPSVILLPAGTITTSVPWVVPGNTKLIGVAKGNALNVGGGINYVLETTIQASFTSGAVVQLGDSHCPSSICQGISVEHLTIVGDGPNLNGIENDNCGSQCTVDHVTLIEVLGTGLKVSGANATDSGPYSNITFDVGSAAATTTQCAHIIGTSWTRGIHAITCIATPAATNGISLDASNNTIEDVRIIGFNNGIVVGANGTADSNVLLNIYGDTAHASQPINLIQISANTVSDLVVMAVSNAGGANTNTIRDLQSSTTLADPFVGMYVLGEANSGGNSRFTTSTTAGANAATWMFGSGAPMPTTGCSTGSLYSDAGGGGLWVCTSTGWSLVI